MDLCISCNLLVRTCQEALACDGCHRWQHRTCQIGISRDVYRAAVGSGQPVDWVYDPCTPNLEEEIYSTIYEAPMVSRLNTLLFSLVCILKKGGQMTLTTDFYLFLELVHQKRVVTTSTSAPESPPNKFAHSSYR